MVRTSAAGTGSASTEIGGQNHDQRPGGAPAVRAGRDLGPVERGGPLKPVIRLLVVRVLGFGDAPWRRITGRAALVPGGTSSGPVLRSALQASLPALSGAWSRSDLPSGGLPWFDQRPSGAPAVRAGRDLGPVERGGPLKPVIRLLVVRVLGFGAVLGVGSPAGPRSSLAGRAPRPVLRSALQASLPALAGAWSRSDLPSGGLSWFDQRPSGALAVRAGRDLGPVGGGGPLKPVIRLPVERVLGFGALPCVGSPAGPRSPLAGSSSAARAAQRLGSLPASRGAVALELPGRPPVGTAGVNRPPTARPGRVPLVTGPA